MTGVIGVWQAILDRRSGHVGCAPPSLHGDCARPRRPAGREANVYGASQAFGPASEERLEGNRRVIPILISHCGPSETAVSSSACLVSGSITLTQPFPLEAVVSPHGVMVYPGSHRTLQSIIAPLRIVQQDV